MTPPQADPARTDLLVVFPTKHLGNLLIALGPVQRAADTVARFTLVADERYAPILRAAGLADRVVPWPRAALARAGALRAVPRFLRTLARLRRDRHDVALDLEGDSVAVNLVRACRAAHRLGSGTIKHPRLYDHVVPLAPTAERPHRWHGYADAVRALGIDPGPPAYGRLDRVPPSESGLPPLPDGPLVALHAGATKAYKLWPPEAFAALAVRLRETGREPVLIGAGATDRNANATINAQLDRTVPDLCDRLDLELLIALFRRCDAFVGNDSGPMHLAAAAGARTLGLFGPTDDSLWGPLGAGARVLRGPAPCAPECTRLDCALGYRCLRSITPDSVVRALEGSGDLAGTPPEDSFRSFRP